MKFPSYDSYANINHPWFPKAPSHWHLSKLKYLFELVKEPAKEHDEIVTCFRDGQVTLRKNRREDGFTNALKEIGYQHVEVNDLVIHAMDAFAGAIGVSDSSGKSSPVYSVCRPIEGRSNSKYFAKLLRHMALSGFVESLAKGIRERSTDFRWADAGNIKLPVPPTKEQQKVAQFLDYETAKIDALIDEQKRLIELLKEKRQAVISHAVTKGLNPNAPMKDSGVEWLGEVPEHWKIQKLSHLTSKIGSGKTPKGGALAYVDSGIKLIRSQNVYDDGLRLTDIAYITSEVDADMYWSRVQAHDILINITGGSIGRTCVISDAELPANVNQHVCIIRLDKQWKGYLDWTAFFLKSVLIKEQINFYQTGSGREGLNFEQLSNFRVPMPPLAEAKNISKHLADELSTIEQLNSRALLCSKLLKERRSALISAAVTGKIDVRDWQPPAGSDTVDSNTSMQTERHYG